jgi:hypothetical protein
MPKIVQGVGAAAGTSTAQAEGKTLGLPVQMQKEAT